MGERRAGLASLLARRGGLAGLSEHEEAGRLLGAGETQNAGHGGIGPLVPIEDPHALHRWDVVQIGGPGDGRHGNDRPAVSGPADEVPAVVGNSVFVDYVCDRDLT